MFSGYQEQGRLFWEWIGRERRERKERGRGQEERKREGIVVKMLVG